MDDSPIQTALCVVGYPIGGNPTQFVALKALAALGLDWQFVSFEVAPDQIQRAISGIDSLGFCGAMIASPYETQAAEILALIRGEPTDDVKTVRWSDCLFRDNDNTLVASNVHAEALSRAINALTNPAGSSFDQCLLIGEHAKLTALMEPFSEKLPQNLYAVTGSRFSTWPLPTTAPTTAAEPISDPLPPEPSPTFDVESVPTLIIWAIDSKPSKKPVSKPTAHSPTQSFIVEIVQQFHNGTVLVDLSGTSGAWLPARNEQNKPSISVITRTDLDVIRLAIAIQRWTGQEPNIDLMREAIEEYLEI